MRMARQDVVDVGGWYRLWLSEGTVLTPRSLSQLAGSQLEPCG